MAMTSNGEVLLADVILQKAISIGLQVTYHQLTPGDGNCLYHAILEAMSSKHINEVFSCPLKLRQDTVAHVQNAWSFEGKHPSFLINWLNLQLNEDKNHHHFMNLCEAQKLSGTYGNELFIAGAARLLQIAIAVTSSGNNPTWPYTIFWPDDNVNSQRSLDSCPFILLGHCDSSVGPEHFQSLIFINDGMAGFQQHNSTCNNVGRTNSAE